MTGGHREEEWTRGTESVASSSSVRCSTTARMRTNARKPRYVDMWECRDALCEITGAVAGAAVVDAVFTGSLRGAEEVVE